MLRLGTLNYRRTPIQGLFIDSGLVRGMLTVRQASVRNISGTTGRISGTLGGFNGFPVFNGSFSASSNNLTGLFRIAGIESPVVPRNLGRLKLTGKAKGAADEIKLQSTLELADAKIELAGQMTDLGATPILDLNLRARHPDSLKLAKLFGVEIGATGRGLGEIDLAAKAKGRLDGLDLTTRLSAIDAELTFTGKVTQLLAQPGLTGTIEARHPDFVGLVRAFDSNYRPAKSVTGPLRFSSQISATDTTCRLVQFEFEVGATSFNGAADISLTGPKTTVTAQITADNIDLDTIFPIGEIRGQPVPVSPAVVAAPAIPSSGKSGVRRYSRELIDLSVLGSFDGDIELSARSITWRSFRINSLRLRAKLQDSVFVVSELTGNIFGGSFDFDALLDGRRVPKLNGTVKIAEANFGKELFADRKFGIINGVFDLDMKLATAGRSQHDMVSTLAGQGRFAARDGMVLGFDLQAVSERLNDLDQPLNFLSLFVGAMGRGTTKFTVLDGTIRIDNGVVRTDDLRMVSKAGLGEARGTIDLARWHLNMQALFRLAGSSNLPPFHVYLTGPPDQPDQKFDIAALQKFLIARIDERGVEFLLNKGLPRLVPQRQSETLVPAQKTPKPEAPSREAPSSVPENSLPLEIKPHEFIRSLLKGLEP